MCGKNLSLCSGRCGSQTGISVPSTYRSVAPVDVPSRSVTGHGVCVYSSINQDYVFLGIYTVVY